MFFAKHYITSSHYIFGEILTETASVECIDSPDGKHCYHGISAVVCHHGLSNDFSEVCCWCGRKESYVVNLPFSYSTNSKPHGPHIKEEYAIGGQC